MTPEGTTDSPTAVAGPSIEQVDGNPIRDNGPYESAEQARAQVDAALYGIPDKSQYTGLVLLEALAVTRVQHSDYEHQQISEIAHRLPPELVQVIAGWIMRAAIGDVRATPAADTDGGTDG